MHILMGLLGAIITILILVNRLSSNGIDIGWLNPFAWKRRREWAKRYHANPVYCLSSPMEVTALLLVALAKSEGDISAEQKREIKQTFIDTFCLDEKGAAALLTSSTYLLKDEVAVVHDMKKLLEPSIDAFTREQAVSALEMLQHIANLDSPATPFQQELIKLFGDTLGERLGVSAGWVQG